MRLNPDVVRGILLTVEDNCNFNNVWEYRKNSFESEYLAELNHEEIIYHIKQCDESGLIQGVHFYDGGSNIIISDLTPAGHEFLCNIRNNSVWKRVMHKGSGASLPILFEIAKQVAMDYYLKLH